MSDASINTIRDMLIGQASALAEEALESLSRAVHADEPEQVALKKLERRITRARRSIEKAIDLLGHND